MNWEVLNMRSKTSSFNGSLFRSNLSRFWPVWAAYLVLLLLTVPTTFTSNLRSLLEYNSGGESALSLSVSWLRETHIITLIFIAVFAVVTAMAVYSFMYSSRSTGMVASLPIKREGVFLTSWLSGYLWLAGAQAVTAFVTILITAVLGYNTAAYVLLWFAIQLLETLFFYGLASLCAVLTGTLFILPAIYAIFNFLFPVAEMLIRAIISPFVYGMPDSGIELTFLSPFIQLMSSVNFDYIRPSGEEVFVFSGLKALICYAVVGIVMSLGALLIFRRRRMEAASDIVAVNVLKPVFRYCMAAGFAITLGIAINYLVFGGTASNNLLFTIISLLVAGFIGYFAAEMLIRKSFKVFDKWPGYVVFAVVVIALMLAVRFDAFGYERRVPEAEKVDSVFASINNQSVDLTEPEHIEMLRSLHSSVVEEHREYENENTANLYISYSLKNGRQINRRYEVGGNTLQQVEDFLNQKDILMQRNSFSFPITPANVNFAYADIEKADGEYVTVDLTPRQAAEFYNDCLLPDLNDGVLGKARLYTYPVAVTDPDVNAGARFTLYISADSDDSDDKDIYRNEKVYQFGPEARRCAAFLDKLSETAGYEVSSYEA